MAAKNTTPEAVPETNETQKEPTQSYAFPEYGLTVQATSLEEANKEVKKLLSANA